MKSSGMAHQLEALDKLRNRTEYALLMEQGTGKTWCLLADAERLYEEGEIDAVLVLAPNGVHTNWVRREIPAHLSVDHHTFTFSSNKSTTKKYKNEWDVFMRRSGALKIFTVNIEAINFPKGLTACREFMEKHRTMLIVDESSRIKNIKSGRTKKAIQLGELAPYRRIASGTPITQGPLDLFSQFEFMKHGLLRCRDIKEFTYRYAEVLPLTNPLVVHATRDPRFPPIIIAKDSNGRPKWKNLDELIDLIKPHSFRVLKKDCLDLPDKVYENIYFDLTADQRKAYDRMEEENRFILDNEESMPVEALAAKIKLQQITSGFILQNGEPIRFMPENPRLDIAVSLVDEIVNNGNKVVVWARFTAEIESLRILLDKYNVVEYSGRIGREDREAAVDNFQNGNAMVFLGQPKAGGIGLTLTAGHNVIFFSNDFELETRLQAEDRNHRIGTVNKVTYYDLVAIDTRDEDIAAALQSKENVAKLILN